MENNFFTPSLPPSLPPQNKDLQSGRDGCGQRVPVQHGNIGPSPRREARSLRLLPAYGHLLGHEVQVSQRHTTERSSTLQLSLIANRISSCVVCFELLSVLSPSSFFANQGIITALLFLFYSRIFGLFSYFSLMIRLKMALNFSLYITCIMLYHTQKSITQNRLILRKYNTTAKQNIHYRSGKGVRQE